ncbi:MAG: response regulator transcription factor [Candidatus Nitronauta litoralis]|uniref:Response regulator transcription factor n=1 Tax=Candidatus Nitronauta litoralis TaxID=2705533 RepID=A0A7T0FZ11_9BACT|nr:MAG: response regulator transcription factor [Candidatus Nitronauta litoralis]
MAGPVRVVIADDHAIVRRGLVQIISETDDLELVGQAENGHELLKLVNEMKPDVAVMDINMPEKSGWDVMLQLKSEKNKVPVLVLSISAKEDYALKFIQAGAAGFLSKASAPEQLVEAIHKVSQGRKFITPELAEQLALQLDQDLEKAPHERLSPREFQVMCLLASGKTVSVVAEELALSVPTISTHRARILEKTGLKNNAELTNYAFRNQLID